MVVRVQGIHHPLIIKRGLGGGDVNGATNGVLAKQDALRPLQHLHPFQVHGQRHCRQCAPARVNAVDIHTHRLLKAGIGTGAHAADKQVGLRLTLVDIHIGNIQRHLFQAGNPDILYFLATHGGDGNRDILQALGTFLRGYENLLQHRLGQGWPGGQGDGQ